MACQKSMRLTWLGCSCAGFAQIEGPFDLSYATVRLCMIAQES